METPYYLMHADHPAAVVIMDDDGWIDSVDCILDAEHLPPYVHYGIENKRKWMPIRGLRKFWNSRLMTRKRFEEYRELADRYRVGAVALKGYGVNLSDAWWVKSLSSSMTWKEVNAYDNPVSSYLAGNTTEYSPDFCTNGNLSKFWKKEEDRWFLYKEGNKETGAEAYNEGIASQILNILGLPHVSYTVKHTSLHGESIAWSVCPAFTSKTVEYIPAWHLFNVAEQRTGEDDYSWFLRCVRTVGIPSVNRDLENMLAFDFLVNNTDRHYGNFGFLRNVETLEWIGLAPIFDNGNCLWFETGQVPRLLGETALPFWGEMLEQLSNLRHVFDVRKLDDERTAALIRDGSAPKIPEEKVEQIIKIALHRKKLLERAYMRGKEI